MKRHQLILLAGAFFSASTLAAPTVYLPLGIDSHLETQLDRMFALTYGTPMHKPYALAEVDNALRLLKGRDITLYRYLTNELKRYRGDDKISRYGARTTFDSGESSKIANQRGLTSEEYGQLFFEGVWRPNDNVLTQIGVDYRLNAKELVAYHSTVSMAMGNLQLDIGYRDHWYSNFKNASQVLSNNAKSPLSMTLSTIIPIKNWWNLDFELFYTKLDEVKSGIRYQDEWHDGRPELIGMHGSIELFEGWQVGFNRVMQFGGGPRDTDLGDIFKAIFNPAAYDNSSSDLSRDEEFGDQMMSITSSFNFHWQMPIELYFEYGAEDTNDHSNFKFGNESLAMGIYLPQLSSNSALRYEVNKWNTSWYVNYNYKFGNTNEGFVFGHYGADDRRFGDGVPSTVHSINYDYFSSPTNSWQLALNTQQNDRSEYQRAYAVSLKNSRKIQNYRLETTLSGGKDAFDEDYAHIAVTVLW